MLKIMVLQALYSLSDDQAEFQIQDRLSFVRFLGLGLSDGVPDPGTIWLFRKQPTKAGAIKAGRIPSAWRDRHARLCQKDREARWTRSSSPRPGSGRTEPFCLSKSPFPPLASRTPSQSTASTA